VSSQVVAHPFMVAIKSGFRALSALIERARTAGRRGSPAA
jgi:hypothetical protein